MEPGLKHSSFRSIGVQKKSQVWNSFNGEKLAVDDFISVCSSEHLILGQVPTFVLNCVYL
jgi:hypothetical protein